jgi:chemotaxis methyl-accepting protein methylase
MHDLSYIRFEGKTPDRPHYSFAEGACSATLAGPPPAGEERLDGLVTWVLGLAGLDAAAYRPEPLARRLPACLRALKVHSAHAARSLLERRPQLVTKVVSSLLIGVTEFFREPDVFDLLRTQVLPELAGGRQGLRVWSAACSTGAELYSMAILLSEAGLLEQSCLLGSDCRDDAIEQARLGHYDAAMLARVPCTTRDKYFQPAGPAWTPVEPLRRQVRWKVADLLAGVEQGPWDVILWRNAAIYLKPGPAETIWRRLVSVLAPRGVLVAGKADRPPRDAGLKPVGRSIYRRCP